MISDFRDLLISTPTVFYPPPRFCSGPVLANRDPQNLAVSVIPSGDSFIMGADATSLRFSTPHRFCSESVLVNLDFWDLLICTPHTVFWILSHPTHVAPFTDILTNTLLSEPTIWKIPNRSRKNPYLGGAQNPQKRKGGGVLGTWRPRGAFLVPPERLVDSGGSPGPPP